MDSLHDPGFYLDHFVGVGLCNPVSAAAAAAAQYHHHQQQQQQQQQHHQQQGQGMHCGATSITATVKREHHGGSAGVIGKDQRDRKLSPSSLDISSSGAGLLHGPLPPVELHPLPSMTTRTTGTSGASHNFHEASSDRKKSRRSGATTGESIINW